MKRLSNDEIFLSQAMLAGSGSTCRRRMVGCVLVNKHKHIIAVGRNGVPSGMPHCLEVPCKGANAPSGTGLDSCQAIHAEQNALIQCRTPMEIDTAYVMASPCMSCVKMLMNTSCRRVVFYDEYPHPEAKALFLSIGTDQVKREWYSLRTVFLAQLWFEVGNHRNNG